MPQDACDCGNESFLFTKDQNLDKAWKTGNKYVRICDDCGSRYFLAKSMYRQSDEQYVIPSGESSPIPIFDCPDDDCQKRVTGKPDECPYCGAEYIWPSEDDEDGEDEDGDDSGEADVDPDDPDPEGEEALDEDDEEPDEGEDDEEPDDDGGDETADNEED